MCLDDTIKIDCFTCKSIIIEQDIQGGKFMKKLIATICAVALTASLAAPMTVSAATKDDIINEMYSSFEIGGRTRRIPSRYVTLVVRYLDNNNLSSAQLDEALAAWSEAKEIWIATGEPVFEELPSDVKMQLAGKAANMLKKLGATVSFSGTTATIVDPNGKSYSVNTLHDLSALVGASSGGDNGSNGNTGSDPWDSGETSGDLPDGGHWELEGNTVTITDKDGNVSTIEVNPIKQTGAGVDTSSAVAVAALLIAGLTATVVVARKNRLGEDCE